VWVSTAKEALDGRIISPSDGSALAADGVLAADTTPTSPPPGPKETSMTTTAASAFTLYRSRDGGDSGDGGGGGDRMPLWREDMPAP
jgi:hypothetical protein